MNIKFFLNFQKTQRLVNDSESFTGGRFSSKIKSCEHNAHQKKKQKIAV